MLYNIVLVSAIHLAFKNMMNKVRDVISEPRNQRAPGDTLPDAVFSERLWLPPGLFIVHLPRTLQSCWVSILNGHS